jgi:hypothetical protein
LTRVAAVKRACVLPTVATGAHRGARPQIHIVSVSTFLLIVE